MALFRYEPRSTHFWESIKNIHLSVPHTQIHHQSGQCNEKKKCMQLPSSTSRMIFTIPCRLPLSGTYDKDTKTGGSDGATMRFAPEAAHGANAGLAEARKRLEPIKALNPQVTAKCLESVCGFSWIIFSLEMCSLLGFGMSVDFMWNTLPTSLCISIYL
jgi:hypothetical protein